jgi:branched-chain amino acid transport system substrate-binding protein
MTKHRYRAAVAGLLAASLIAAGCGGDDKGDSSAPDTTAAATTSSPTPGSGSATTTTTKVDPLAALGVDIKKDCPADYEPSQGVSDTEILIGQSVPKSGPQAAFGLLTTGMQAYFDYANAELDGVNGKKLKLVALDDGYDPEKTVKNVNDLISQGVFATSGILGTAQNLAVRDTLNDKCIPQLFPSTGSPEWGDVDHYPWTVAGVVVPYNVEARIWADYLKKTFPNGAKVVALEADSAFGSDYETWFKKYIAGSNITLTKVEKADPLNSNVTNQMTNLAATNADVAIAMVTGTTCTEFMKGIGASSWKPTKIISGTCKSSIYFLGGGEGAKDALSVAANKEITYPEYDTDADVVKVRALLAKYAPAGTPLSISLVPTGWTYGELLRDTLLRASALDGGLTRPNALVAARQMSFTSKLLYDGITLKMDGKKDAFPLEAGRLEKWTGTAFAKVTDLYVYDGETKAKP